MNGFLVESNPKQLAECFDQLYLDKKKAKKMGEEMHSRLSEMQINWENVVRRLTS
jgi:glycosyltransferase involved in cell wall biosynthesis